jgi:hypothetical protein
VEKEKGMIDTKKENKTKTTTKKRIKKRLKRKKKEEEKEKKNSYTFDEMGTGGRMVGVPGPRRGKPRRHWLGQGETKETLRLIKTWGGRRRSERSMEIRAVTGQERRRGEQRGHGRGR